MVTVAIPAARRELSNMPDLPASLSRGFASDHCFQTIAGLKPRDMLQGARSEEFSWFEF